MQLVSSPYSGDAGKGSDAVTVPVIRHQKTD